MNNIRPAANIDELRDLVARVLEIPADDVTDNAHLVDELKIDSLTEMEIASRLEKRYRIKFSDEEITSLTTLQDFRELVDRKLGERSADVDADPVGRRNP